MRKTFIATLLEHAKQDPSILLVTGDLGYGVLDEFERSLPNQFLNAGVTEQSMIGLAAGFASMGHHVFVYSIANFPTLRCLEQIRNDVCYMNNPVTVVSVGAGFAYGSQGYSHHALEDIAVMRAMPNLEVVVPMDADDARNATKYLLNSRKPSYLRIGKDNEPALNTLSLRRENVNKFFELRTGDAATILFVGGIGSLALGAADKLKDKGINVSVAGCTNITNLDSEYLVRAANQGPVITVEEHAEQGGFGSRIAEWFLGSANQTPKMALIAARRANLKEIGDQDFLRQSNGLSIDNIVQETFKLVALHKENK